MISLATALGYKFDEEDMHRVYAPIGHAQEAAENQAARQLLLQLLRGETFVKTHTSIFPGDVQASKDFNDVLLAVLKGERALKFEEIPPQERPPRPTYLK